MKPVAFNLTLNAHSQTYIAGTVVNALFKDAHVR